MSTITPIHKVLIANRGEIAVRIIRTCRTMGIATVAVFSDADANAPHVDAADEAVRIGPAPAAESYLHIERVLDAAALTGADALHPGYGFLAENPALARECKKRNVTFIGPPEKVIARLGSKREARRIAAQAGVPVVPGYDGAAQDTDALRAAAQDIGFPVLLKASAGGGGKGMRVVHDDDELTEAIAAARREAMAAFADDTLLIERYIESPRHVEIQILGDTHGNIVHLFERECSIQRRHQKIIEEAPSPALDQDLRDRMGAAAVAVAAAVGYVNAGTVEFILAPDRSFYFLEVNTRLQVEHPVTEHVTGVDLVRQQIRVAMGHPLELGAVALRGAAIECRLYAEDPDRDFLPAAGRLADWHVPDVPGLRVDAGVASGQDVSVHYDPMLAKIITGGPTRAEAIERMIYSLRGLSVAGVTTNRDLLIRVLSHPAFARGDTHTHFLGDHAADLAPPPAAAHMSRILDAAIAATLAGHETRRAARSILPALEPGFRTNPFAHQSVTYEVASRAVTVAYHNLGGGRFAVTATPAQGEPRAGEVTVIRWQEPHIVLQDDRGRRLTFRVICRDDHHYVHGTGGSFTLVETPRFPRSRDAAVEGGCVAPMPGRIIKLLVHPGKTVAAGDTLVILEAMKMEHPVKAPLAGVIADVLVAEADQVDTGAVLVVLAAE